MINHPPPSLHTHDYGKDSAYCMGLINDVLEMLVCHGNAILCGGMPKEKEKSRGKPVYNWPLNISKQANQFDFTSYNSIQHQANQSKQIKSTIDVTPSCSLEMKLH
jgi:hypothetical protein